MLGKKPRFVRKKVTLTFEVVLQLDWEDDLVGDDALRTALDGCLNESTDGRQLFGVEILKDGLSRLVESSLRQAVFVDVDGRHSHMTTLDGCSLSCRLADHKMEKLRTVHIRHDVAVDELRTLEEELK